MNNKLVTVDQLRSASERAVNHVPNALSVGGIPIVTATSSDGISYVATVDGVTELYIGLTIRIIPNMNSAQVTPTLNVNNLGAKNIIMPIDGVNSTIQTNAAKMANWVCANKPMELTYDGGRWRSEVRATSASSLYGRVPVDGGGVPIPSTTDDEGKFLRSVSGVPTWVAVDSAEEATF